MNMLNIIFAHVLYSSFMASILILLVFAIKKIFQNRLSARFYNMLWILVLIRLLMPFEIESSFSILNLFPEKIQIISNSLEQNFTIDWLSLMHSQTNRNSKEEYYQDYVEDTENQGKLIIQQPELKYTITEKNDVYHYGVTVGLLAKIWLIGILSLFLLSCIITISFKHRSKHFNKISDPEINLLVKQCCEKLHIKKSIPIYVDSSFKSPCISGLIRPSIYLPEDICSTVPQPQLEHILLHELAHYKRKDLFHNLFATLLALLHWFNPLVWFAIKEMRYDREIACDTYVMEILGENGVIPYGMTIINMSSLFSARQRQFNLVNFNETNNQVERRITMIKNFKKGSYKVSAIAILCFLVIAAVTLTQAVSPKQGNTPAADANPALHSPIDNESNITANTKIKDKLVVIDPAHGGNDLGATYPLNSSDPEAIEVMEKDLNLDISLKLYDMLKKSGINAEMTRYEDDTLKLEDRPEFANNLNASLFVCIHCDANPKSSANGTITFFDSSKESSYGITEEKAAQLIHKGLVKQLETTDMGLHNNNFKVLRDTKMPAVLTEIAYISNESDREKLMTEEFRTKAAQALHDSIIEILNEMVASESK